MFCYYLSVSGIAIQLESEEELSVPEAFIPFLTEQTEPDIRAVFRQTAMLSHTPSQELYRNNVWQICLSADGYPVRYFYDKPEDQDPYALAIWDGKTLRVEYLPSEVWRFSLLQHCFFCLDMEQILILRNRLWLHASCVDTPLGGILFSGPSGIGKSTQANLWCKYRGARQINCDRPNLSPAGKEWIAWGAPYAGSSRCYVNDNCPVCAIVMLKQADQCSSRRLNLREAFRAIWSGLAIYSWDRDYVERASSLAMKLIETVPVYEFCCTPDEQAVIYLEQALRKELRL